MSYFTHPRTGVHLYIPSLDTFHYARKMHLILFLHKLGLKSIEIWDKV